MRLLLNDGYTLKAETSPEWREGSTQWQNLPSVKYDYRPALSGAIYDWQMSLSRAASGREQLDATAVLIAGHLVSWDVIVDVSNAVEVAKIEPATVRQLPYPILQQILAKITTWAPRNQEAAAGNSERVSG